MGNCCQASSDANSQQRSTDIYSGKDECKYLVSFSVSNQYFEAWFTNFTNFIVSDLDAPNTQGISDRYRVFELETPFARTNINQFFVQMKIAKQECGDGEFLTLSALRAQLKTPAWQPLEDENSAIAKFLLSSAFKTPGLA